ncbi:hypothetical protein KQI85_09235 [Falcatimonas sp. MSJ-15]|uniref:hypothetical protein n=1 Tax=Falcatimonas sp. MSJ-15 TaxID=2841515 RepID=UPI001C1134A7|nr:hypothetical protein [Falcatimonas sp. MSJ-15]MBU5470557.1 hypothetical protein [Falcatimonas sp. MSJ-15]
MARREDGKMALSFEILDGKYSLVFVIFCIDMIKVCEKSGKEMIISTAFTRWKYWQEMFGKRKIVRKDVSQTVGNVSYTLMTDGLTKFMEE